MFFVKLPQNRHPERSASQIDCVTQCLWRGVEGPRRRLFYPCCSELFDHRSRQQDLLWLLLLESPFWLHPSQMGFATFDSPALIRGRSRVALSFPSLLCGLSAQMQLLL